MHCESSLQGLRAATMKKKTGKNFFANWSVFSRRNVLVWEDEALVGLPFDEHSSSKEN